MNSFVSLFRTPPPPTKKKTKKDKTKDPDTSASKSVFNVFNAFLRNEKPKFQNLNPDFSIES